MNIRYAKGRENGLYEQDNYKNICDISRKFLFNMT